MPGIIEKAVMSGSDNPSLYMRRFPSEERKSGGYRLQDTPHEIAQAVSVIRAYAAPRYMICFGVETGGSERFLAEECGVMVYSSDRAFPDSNRLPMESAGIREVPMKGDADLIVIRGGNHWQAAMKHCKLGTVVCVVGTIRDVPRGKAGLARECWTYLRNNQHRLLQTQDFGIGVARIDRMIEINEAKKGKGAKDAVQEQSAEKVDVREQAGDGEEVVKGNSEVESPSEAGEERESVKWARAHDKCVSCGTTETKHVAGGYCRTCYPKRGKK